MLSVLGNSGMQVGGVFVVVLTGVLGLVDRGALGRIGSLVEWGLAMAGPGRCGSQ